MMKISLTPSRSVFTKLSLMPPTPGPHSDHLCFVSNGNYWTPGLQFDNYAVMLQILHETLGREERLYLTRQAIATMNAGPVVQLMENTKIVLLQPETRPFHLHLGPAMMENTIQELGTELYQKWRYAMNQVDKLLAKEQQQNAIDVDIDVDVDIDLAKKQMGETKKRTSAPADTGIWGCVGPRKKKFKSQAVNKPPTGIQKVPSSKSIGRKDVPAKKALSHSLSLVTKISNQKLSILHKPKSIPKPLRRPKQDNFYVFNHVWSILKERGWKFQRNKNPLLNWVWLSPDCKNQATGILGTNMFASEDEVLAYCKKINLKSQVGYETEDDNENDNENDNGEVVEETDLEEELDDEEQDMEIQETPKNAKTRPQDPAAPLLSPCSIVHDRDDSDYWEWKNVWRRLSRFGWTIKSAAKYNPLHGFYYVRPHKHPSTGVLGRDYFASPADVIAYERSVEGVQHSIEEKPKKKSSTTMLPINDIATTKKKKKKQSDSRRISMSPPPTAALPPSKPFKEEWFHKENMPHYLEIWAPILRDQLSFTYTGGQYVLPDGSQRFRADQEMRSYLLQHGIPNIAKLVSGKDLLMRWLTFCHVPVNDKNSRNKLHKTQVLDDDAALALLQQLGLTKRHGGKYSISEVVELDSMDDVRVWVRATSNLLQGQGRRAKNPLSETQQLELRVWAAMSPWELPVYTIGGISPSTCTTQQKNLVSDLA